MSFADTGQESVEEVQPQSGEDTSIQDHSQQEEAPQTQDQGNPFWKDVEQLTGPNVYKLIQPHLAKADAEANKRISALNEQYAPWKAFADQQITPDQVNGAFQVVHRLNDPNGQLEIYTALQNFLKENGRLPDQEELAQQVVEDEAEQQEDPRVAELAQQQQAIMEFLQNQQLNAQRQAAAKEADTWLDSETSRLQGKGYDEADLKEIVRIAAFQATQSGKDPDSLDAAAAQYDALRDRIRTTPRPSQGAPRIPSGPGGGTPSGGAIDASKLTRQQRIELSAQVMAQRKAQGQ